MIIYLPVFLSSFVKKTIISVLYYISVICKKNKSVTVCHRSPDPIVAISKTLFKKQIAIGLNLYFAERKLEFGEI